MTDFRTLLAELRRPRLLIRAARHGLADYHRERDLKRLLDTREPASPEGTLPQLMSEEERLEDSRRNGSIGYSLSHHIEVLIALMAEVRLLPRDLRA